PGLVATAMHDVRPTESSPVVAQGTTTTVPRGSMPVPSPLMLPAFNPPQRRLIPIGTAEARSFTGAPSIGAFEPNAAAPGPPPPPLGPPPTLVGGDGSGGSGDGGSSGCKCRMSPYSDVPSGGLAGLVVLALALGRRSRLARASSFDTLVGHPARRGAH